MKLRSRVHAFPFQYYSTKPVMKNLLPDEKCFQHSGARKETSGTQTQQTSEPDPARRTDSRKRMSLEDFSRKHGMKFLKPT